MKGSERPTERPPGAPEGHVREFYLSTVRCTHGPQTGKPKLKGIYMRGIVGYITDEIRNRGVKDTLKEAGLADKIEWTEQYADFSRAKAQSVAGSILAKSQDYDFVITDGDNMILGALGAVKAAGLLRKVLLYTSVDGLPRQSRPPFDGERAGGDRPKETNRPTAAL